MPPPPFVSWNNLLTYFIYRPLSSDAILSPLPCDSALLAFVSTFLFLFFPPTPDFLHSASGAATAGPTFAAVILPPANQPASWQNNNPVRGPSFRQTVRSELSGVCESAEQ